MTIGTIKTTKFLEKIIVNSGIGKLRSQAGFNDKILPEIKKEFAIITGQVPSIRKAKKSIAGFKLREGEIIGLKVTLRKNRMEDFLKRVVSVAIPRVKDFRGIELKNVDTNGNLNIGLRNQYIFPEINIEKSKTSFGIQITLVPLDHDREKAIDFYRSYGVPLKNQEKMDSKKNKK